MRPRLGFTRDNAAPWRHSVSPTSRQTLENHWYSYEWIKGRKPNLFTQDRKTFLSHQELRVDCCSWPIRWRRQFKFNKRTSWISFAWRQYSSGPISWEKLHEDHVFFRTNELEVKNPILLDMSQQFSRNKHYDVLIAAEGLLDTVISSSSASAPVETPMVKRRWSRNHQCTARPVESSVRKIGRTHWKLGGRKNFFLLERDSRSSRIMSSSSPIKKWFSEITRFTFIPKNAKCEVCKRIKITRTPCTKTNKQSHTSRKECLLTLVTTDHKIPNEDDESHNNQWFAVVVPILSTQWIHSLSRSTRTSHETTRSCEKYLDLNPSPSVIYIDNPLKFWEVSE